MMSLSEPCHYKVCICTSLLSTAAEQPVFENENEKSLLTGVPKTQFALYISRLLIFNLKKETQTQSKTSRIMNLIYLHMIPLCLGNWVFSKTIFLSLP